MPVTKRCCGCLLVLLVVLAGCQPANTPTAAPTTVPAPSAVPTTPPRPTPSPPDLRPFLPSLRSEFAADLAGMASAPRYDIDLHVDTARLLVTGREVVNYTNRSPEPLEAIYLRLFANFPACQSSTEVRNVRARGQVLAPRYEVEGTALRVPLDPPLAPGEQISLSLGFEAKIPNQAPCRYEEFNYREGIITMAHVYPQVAVYDEHGWNLALGPDYGDLVYADAALYSVTLTLPTGWVVAASGTEVVHRQQKGGEVTMAWVAGPARDFNLVLGQDYLTLGQEVGDILVTSYYFPGHEAGGQRALDYAVQALAVYESRFGPYRYRELDVVETRIEIGGIEYPGLVVITNWFYDEQPAGLETAVAHEVAHQWWYNLVGNDQVGEPWLDEALTTYSTDFFYQEVEGEEAGRQAFTITQECYQQAVKAGLDAPVDQPVAAYSPETYGPLVYCKGALFFHALRREVGDALFWPILQEYYRRFLYDRASGEAFLALAEEVSGRSLRALYQAWILSPTPTPP